MLHINLENVINQVKNKGFTETPVGFKKTLNNGTIPITDQICFRRITTLSEYILNLNEKGLDITNIERISNPKIHKDFLSWEYAQIHKSSNLYKLSRIKGLGRGQIFLKDQNGEKEQKPLLTSLLKSKMVSAWEYFKYSQATKMKTLMYQGIGGEVKSKYGIPKLRFDPHPYLWKISDLGSPISTSSKL